MSFRWRKFVRSVAAAAAGCALAGGCGGDEDPVAPPPGACPRPLGGSAANGPVVSVSAGPTPVITWSPACRVADVLVVESNASEEVNPVAWVASSSWVRAAWDSTRWVQPNAIESGVIYGTTPSGATTDGVLPARPLRAGGEYLVVLLVREESRNNVAYTAGQGAFRR